MKLAEMLMLRSKEQRGGNQALDAQDEAEQEGLERTAAPVAARIAHLELEVASGWRLGERALALEEPLCQIFGDGVHDLWGVHGFGEDRAAVAGFLQEPVDALVAAHAYVRDSVDP